MEQEIRKIETFNPILVWFYREIIQRRLWKYLKLSIPFWSDFIVLYEPHSCGLHDEPFNPILVWFYLLPAGSPLASVNPFNPILVWFYRELHRCSPLLEPHLSIPFWSDFIQTFTLPALSTTNLSIPFWSDFIGYEQKHSVVDIIHFQSHFGLILSWTQKKRTCQLLTFNPILVWFYLNRLPGFAWDKRRTFNPILVWFYHTSHVRAIPFHRDSFNPILVWFYHTKRTILANGITAFQSHFGLILSKQLDLLRIKLKNASFNPILVWFYRGQELQQNQNGELSIPFWSDFITPCPLSSAAQTSLFQSHFGLILSCLVTRQELGKSSAFNPILVWFYRPS